MSIQSTITQGLSIPGGYTAPVGDTLTQGYEFKGIISDVDAEKIAAFVWERILENGLQAQEMMRLMLSTQTGLVSGMPGEPIFLSNDGSKTRIRMITDENGNRLKVVVLDGS